MAKEIIEVESPEMFYMVLRTALRAGVPRVIVTLDENGEMQANADPTVQ